MKAMLLVAAVFSLTCAQELPEAPAKSLVKKICADCHGLENVTGVRRTKDRWEATVDEMVTRDAKGTDEEFDTVVAYLAKFFGKVNVNTAVAKEIEDVGDFTEAEAEAIVQYRTQNGEFKNLDDLRKIKNLN